MSANCQVGIELSLQSLFHQSSQLADIFTRPLGKEAFCYILHKLGSRVYPIYMLQLDGEVIGFLERLLPLIHVGNLELSSHASQ
jgi:hypothetical protein